MFSLFFNSQFTETFLTERDKQSKWSGIPQLLLKLHATSHLHSDFAECQNILKVTLKELGGAYSGTLGDTSCLLFFPFCWLLKIASFYCVSCRKFEKFRKSTKKKINITYNPIIPR